MRFLAVDMPKANDLTVGIMAQVAQAEREAISRRTKEVLAVTKARGVWPRPLLCRLSPASLNLGKEVRDVKVVLSGQDKIDLGPAAPSIAKHPSLLK